MLIINSKSGPESDSLLQTRTLVELLARHGIAADIRVKVRASQARREARAAARAGYALVVAAGGDGTVEAVGRGLIGSQTVLGIVPLGTYNNVATSLGIPTDLAQACALIAAAPVRAIDVGEVRVYGRRRRRLFFEAAAVGIAAPLAIAGSAFKNGRWEPVVKHLPEVIEIAPEIVGIKVDSGAPAHHVRTLLAVVANTPRAGAGLSVVPRARIDDGLFDVRVYEDMSPAELAAHFVAVTDDRAEADPHIQTWRGSKLVIRSRKPMPVVADSKVVGSTPARFRLLSGALLVIVGRGDALTRPATEGLMAAVFKAEAAKRSGVAVVEVDGSGQSPEADMPALGEHRNGPGNGLLPRLSRWLAARPE
jgi:diacylglycerol kinase (ATP)